jgi:dynein heavy chain
MALTAEALRALGEETGAALEKELDDWETASSSAYEILNTVKKGDCTELKSFAAPPQLVKDVLRAVLIVFRERDADSWPAAKKMLGNQNFLRMLKEFDPSTIDATMVKKLRPLVGEFSDDRTRKVSKAVAGMAAFVRAVYEYGRDRVGS